MSSVIIYYFSAIILQLLFVLPSEAFPFSQGISDSNSEASTSGVNSSIFLSLLSIGSVITLISVLVVCGAGGCWSRLPKIHWFGRSRRIPPMSFDNPVAELGLGSRVGSSIPLSQIDVRALELDPVVFEPLPTIQDLSPLSLSNHGSGSEDGRYSGRYLPVSPLIQNTSSMVPFANEDSELYAHDWFDEPYRNFQRNNIEFIREVGRGWFGEVLEAEAKDIVPFAKIIKVLVKRLKQDATQLDQMRFLDESRIYRDANQGNILKLLGHSIEKLPFLLIMEHCPQGDLKSYLISNVTRAETLSTQGMLLNMALDIAKGLEWMINEGFKHSDLAARNCQVASEGRIIIGDYGLATHLYKDDYYWNSNVPIPLRWAAPETIHCTQTTIQTLKVTKSSNVWTYAVVLWEVTEFAKLPYFELNDEEVITRVLAEKQYFLGQPTLPYIPFKEQLYDIMQSCWSIDPAKRPSMSTIVTQLQQLLSNLERDRKGDDFESKWERLGRISSSSSGDMDGRPRVAKKSVSFTGIQNMMTEMESITPSSVERLRKIETDDDVIGASREQMHGYQEQYDDENDKWLQEMEDGGITQKVMQKTTSVQDFMVLTHLDPSDIHGPESLIGVEIGAWPNNISNVSFASENTEESASTYEPPEFPLLSKISAATRRDPNNDSGMSNNPSSFVGWTPSNTRVETTSESAFLIQDSILSSSSQSESSKQETTGNTTPSIVGQQYNGLSVPEISVQASTPGTTPNMTGIDINVTEASPRPALDCTLSDDTMNTTNSILQATINSSKPRIVFNFSDTEMSPSKTTPKHPGSGSGSGRHTSTPKRSASMSPLPHLNDSNGYAEDVFDSPPSVDLNTTCNLSPITVKKTRSGVIQSGELVTTIVGASDDLGLEIFQGVKSQLDYGNEYFEPVIPPEMEPMDFYENPISSVEVQGNNFWNKTSKGIQNGNWNFQDHHHTPFGKDIPILAGDIRKGQPMSLTPRPNSNIEPQPKALFQLSEESSEIEQGTLMVADTQNSSSWEDVSNTDASSGPSSFCKEFVPSIWNQCLQPARPAIKSPCAVEVSQQSNLKKSVSFERKKQQIVYEYPPPPPVIDTAEDLYAIRTHSKVPTIPLHSSLDWDLTQEELEFAQINSDDSDEDLPIKAESDPMDMYRISGFEFEDSFKVRSSSEPFSFQPPSSSTLGQLRHTRDKLNLDLSKGEACLLDDDIGKIVKNSNKTQVLDSGVGSSTNVSPFVPCHYDNGASNSDGHNNQQNLPPNRSPPPYYVCDSDIINRVESVICNRID